MKIALLGYGTVGSGTYELIDKNKEMILKRYNTEVEVTSILVRNLEKYKDYDHFNLFTTDPKAFLTDDVDVVIELIGGLDPAYDYIKSALKNSKHVISANKDLIAEHFTELTDLAYENKVSLNYEAAVAGGIPILKPIQSMLPGNLITDIYGIINGTTNFILSQMYENNLSYAEALKIAQDSGFAESNPTSDVEGLDASRKLALLSMLSFGVKVPWQEILTTGITSIDNDDIKYAKDLGKKVKLFAISKMTDKGLYLGVRPIYIYADNALSKIDNEYNGIHLISEITGDLLLYGKGAGKFPTGSAVISDLLSILDGNKIKKYELDDVKILSDYPEKTSWFVRFKSNDFSETTNKIFDKFSAYKFDLSTYDFNKEITMKIYDIDEANLKTLLDQLSVEMYKYYLVIKGD